MCTVSRRLDGAGKNTKVCSVDAVNLLTSERDSIDFCGMSRSSAVSSREGIGRGCGTNGLTASHNAPCHVGVVSGMKGKGPSRGLDG